MHAIGKTLYTGFYIYLYRGDNMGIPLGYYTERIDWLEERRNQISARIYADRLALKAINKEIDRCKEAMQKTEDYVS